LLRHGLLNEDLAFDTFLDAPPWPKVERFLKERRPKEQSPLEAGFGTSNTPSDAP